MAQVRDGWTPGAYGPLDVSTAQTMPEFQDIYYPIVVYCKDKRYWIATPLNPNVDLEPRSVDRHCRADVLGKAVLEMWEEVRRLLAW
jgi:hypothetical protein